MFSLTIALGNVSWQLLFHKEEDATQAYKHLIGPEVKQERVLVTDDFGQELNARRESINGFLFEDLDKSALARIEMGLHQARMQAKGNQMAESDPVLKQARMRASMGVLSPMGMGPVPGLSPNGRG